MRDVRIESAKLTGFQLASSRKRSPFGAWDCSERWNSPIQSKNVMPRNVDVEVLLEFKLPIKLHSSGIVVGAGEGSKVWIVKISVHLELVTAEDVAVK
jgi:hypothetical protein